MTDHEREEPTLDVFIAAQEAERQKKVSEERPEIQRRLKIAILNFWEEFLDIKQLKVPGILKKISKDKLSEAARITLWMSPSPLTEIKYNEIKMGSVTVFTENSQAMLWKKGQMESVIGYFTSIVEDKILVEHPSKIPEEIRKITEGKMPESALIIFWELPSPWLWGQDERDWELDWRRSPAGMWKDNNDREGVTDYMRVLADNLETPLQN